MIVRRAVGLALALFVMQVSLPVRAQQPAAAPAPIESIPLPKQGKQVLNASGVVPLADSRFLICDNRTNDALFELTVGPAGESAGPLVRRPVVVKGGYLLEDMEDLTLAETPEGRYLFISTSLSVKKASKKSQGAPVARPGGLIRIKYTETGPLEAEVIPEFRDWLIKRFAKNAAVGSLEPDKGGLNVEGLAWDPARSALLVGVRSPVGEGVAYVAPIKIPDVSDHWSASHLEALPLLRVQTGATTVPLGIRGIEYDAGRRAFLVILGNAYSGGDAPFQLCLWDGQDATALKRFEGVTFVASAKPEGVSTGVVAGKPVIVIADDSGGYRVLTDDDVRPQ